jgi:transposase InsO family protein
LDIDLNCGQLRSEIDRSVEVVAFLAIGVHTHRTGEVKAAARGVVRQIGTVLEPVLRQRGFSARMRDELLNETLFFGIDHARDAVADWVQSYNTERPHSALGYQTPTAFAAQLNATDDWLRAP